MAHCSSGGAALFCSLLSTSAGGPGFSRSCANLQSRVVCGGDKCWLCWEVLSGALALSCPEAEAPTCAVCVLGHSGVLQLCSGTPAWWERLTNMLSECRRINFVHRHSSTLCASCSSSGHPCKLHSVCYSLNESKCTYACG